MTNHLGISKNYCHLKKFPVFY